MQKLRLNSKLIVMILAVLIISIFAFAGCDDPVQDDPQKDITDTTPNTGGITETVTEYKGPIKNVNEMVEYASNTVYNNLNKQVENIPASFKPTGTLKNYWLLTSDGDQNITKIVLYCLSTPDANKPDEMYFHTSTVSDSIKYGDLLIDKNIYFGSNTKSSNPISKAKYEANLPLAKAIGAKHDIAEDDIVFAYIDIKDKPTTAPTEPTGTPTTHQHVKITYYTKTSMQAINVDILAGADVEALIANYNNGDVLNEKSSKVKAMGNIFLDGTVSDKAYPAA